MLIEFFINSTFIMLMHAFIHTFYVKLCQETVWEHGIKGQVILNHIFRHFFREFLCPLSRSQVCDIYLTV